MEPSSPTPSLTPSRSPSPEPPVQPDHFYGSEGVPLPPSPDSQGRTWLDPEDDPNAARGIPVFKPTMEEFQDFEGYLNKIEVWGNRSGIVKVIPPKEWSDALPAVGDQLPKVHLKSPIEQYMDGQGGLFRQKNIEKRKAMSVREWAELCSKPDYAAPGVDDVVLRKPDAKSTRKRRTKKSMEAEPRPKEESEEQPHPHTMATPPNDTEHEGSEEEKPRKGKGRRPQKEVQSEKEKKDAAFFEDFDPHSDWLPSNTAPCDYTPEFCSKLERQYWRNCGIGKSAWYGADMAGSLFTNETTAWNVARLPSLLERILPRDKRGVPGVNMPYLYFGMWRATFAWHVEDMDLHSINYIHFGAPKFWYAVPQARANALESVLGGFFPEGPKICHQFLRHKSYLASPSLLAGQSCRPNTLVQKSGEFVITFPRGYHAGFNMGFNCAESVNFALDSWLELGRKAKACKCIDDSVTLDVDELLQEREAERIEEEAKAKKAAKAAKVSRKRKSDEPHQQSPNKKSKKNDKSKSASPPKRTKPSSPSTHNIASTSTSVPALTPASAPAIPTPRITLKLGPRPKESEPFPCCLCVSTDQEGLLEVQHPPTVSHPAYADIKKWMTHEECAKVVPETWVDTIFVPRADGSGVAEKKVVLGVDAIVKDRWNLKCTACTKTRPKAHGAPIQCTKGKCPKAFHISCARSTESVVYEVVQEVDKEVVLVDAAAIAAAAPPAPAPMPLPDFVSTAMDVDAVPSGCVTPAELQSMTIDVPEPRVVKIVKKMEVRLLCSQHNPAMTEAKRVGKLDKMRKDLLALEAMARIKVRVSAGVFEVSLVRVVEETNSVEVLWDRGIKKEFKWGSVVWGNTDGLNVGQKPTEPAPEPRRDNIPPVTYPSLSVAMSKSTTAYTPPAAPAPLPTAPSHDTEAPMASLLPPSATLSTATTPAPSQPASTAASSVSRSYTPYQPRTTTSTATTATYNYDPSSWTYPYPHYPSSTTSTSQYNPSLYNHTQAYATPGTSTSTSTSAYATPSPSTSAYATPSTSNPASTSAYSYPPYMTYQQSQYLSYKPASSTYAAYYPQTQTQAGRSGTTSTTSTTAAQSQQYALPSSRYQAISASRVHTQQGGMKIQWKEPYVAPKYNDGLNGTGTGSKTSSRTQSRSASAVPTPAVAPVAPAPAVSSTSASAPTPTATPAPSVGPSTIADALRNVYAQGSPHPGASVVPPQPSHPPSTSMAMARREEEEEEEEASKVAA